MKNQVLMLPNQQLSNLRTKIAEEMIIDISNRLNQKVATKQLALRIFEVVCASKTMNDGLNQKNETKNLRVLAAQCLLLASKFVEVQRLYPAEIVYQVKGWANDEFEVLRSGQVEEFILNILQFDLMFLTPCDYVYFYM